VSTKSNHRYFIRFSYNGTRYHGWQIQQNAPSVQETLTDAISKLSGLSVALVGCGRTDTGVHAKEFYAHFDAGRKILDTELDHLVFRLNRFLPQDIAISWIRQVPGDLHARFSASSRTYRYYAHTFKDPFLTEISWFVHDVPDLNVLNQGARLLMKYEDFTSFSKLHTDVKNNICQLVEAKWDESGHRLMFTITADRFLRNMVRAIVGTLMDLGQGKISMAQFEGIIEAKNRSGAGQSVPAHGLYLEKVVYPLDFN
jgi:tRNA pseudouridine38-40 synthase